MHLSKKIILFLCLCLPFFLQAQDDNPDAILKDALRGWDVLANNITLEAGSYRDFQQKKVYVGTATGFGQSVSFEAKLRGTKPEQIALVFPEAAQVNTQMVRDLTGEGLDQILPPELNANLRIERLAIDFAGKKIIAVSLQLGASNWAPAGGNDLKMQDIRAVISVLDPKSSKKSLGVSVSSTLFLPKEITKFFQLEATQLTVQGSVNTKTKRVSLFTDLSSEGIPLGDKENLFLRNSYIEFFIEGKEPGLALGGKLEVRPKDGPPILLNGEVSIDLTGEIFGQGWMTGSWRNPFGISDQVYVTNLGLGLGATFGKGPIPLPVIALEGGMRVGSPNANSAKFSARVTLGLNAGKPDENMIHADSIYANAYDIINAFYPPGVPANFSKVLQSIRLSDARLTVVPPGDGVNLFGTHYFPGAHLQGTAEFGSMKGELLLSISPTGVIAYAGLTPINIKGFALTGVQPGTGPKAFFMIRKGTGVSVEGGLGLDGRVTILGASRSANIYVTDKGFNATVDGKILNSFEAKVDLAANNPFVGEPGNAFVQVSLKTDLFNRINTVAAQHIGMAATDVNNSFRSAEQGLETNRPLMESSKKKYESVKEEVRAEYKKLCAELNTIEAQQAVQQKEQQRLTGIITNLDTKISNLKSKIANGYKPANFIKRTTCADMSKWDPYDGGGCWECPGGFARDLIYPVYGDKACVKASYKVFTAANYHGKGEGLLGTDCGSGQFYDPINGGGCWSIPAGYQRENLIAINKPNACSKVIPAEHRRATRIADLKCPAPAFVDPRNGGECWECPSGYVRPATTEPVTSQKACELSNMLTLRKNLALAEADRTATIADRDVIKKTLGDLSNMISKEMETACKGLSDSEVINADPRVAPKLAEYTKYLALVEGFQKTLAGLRELSVGTLNAAEWVAEHGGKALGVVDVRQASFTACLNTAAGGKVALKVKGSFAGSPLDASFDIAFASPDSYIKIFADALMNTNSSKATINNGTCTRPTIPSPFLNDNLFTELKGKAGEVQSFTKARPRMQARPGWAGPRKFEQGGFSDQLKLALDKGDTKKILDLAGYGIDLNVRDKNRATALIWVAAKGNLANVTYLVSQGADPTLTGVYYSDAAKKSPIGSLQGMAIHRSDPDMLTYFIEGVGLPVDGREAKGTGGLGGYTPIERAALKGSKSMVNYLLEQGASPGRSPGAVLYATQAKKPGLAQMLIKKGFGYKQADAKTGFRSLHLASREGELELVKTLISQGADINAVSAEGWTPLILAAYHGKTEVCKALVEAGANLEIKYDRKNASKWARKQGFKDLGKYLKNPDKF